MATITEEVGDIFDSPPNSILIHACNVKGVWGSGVALAFKKRFPKAYKQYRSHCLSTKPPAIAGTTLLIPPHSDDGNGKTQPCQDDRYIACLFTSHGYGKAVDPPDTILKNTRAALDDLASQLDVLRNEKSAVDLGQCTAVSINSGKFGVPWSRTKEILKEGSLDMVVVRPEIEEVGEGEGGKWMSKGLRRGGLRGKSEKRVKVGEAVEMNGSKESRTVGDLAGDLGESRPTKRRRTRGA